MFGEKVLNGGRIGTQINENCCLEAAVGVVRCETILLSLQRGTKTCSPPRPKLGNPEFWGERTAGGREVGERQRTQRERIFSHARRPHIVGRRIPQHIVFSVQATVVTRSG